MLKLEHLYKTFNPGTINQKVALSDLSLHLNPGDFVTVIGRDGGEEITMEEISEKAGTFNYEFVCGFQRRVPRIYTENGHIIKILDYLEETI